MPPGKRNQFLDADESDDEHSQGYSPEEDEFTKGGRSAKRRKVQSDSEADEDASDGEDGFDAIALGNMGGETRKPGQDGEDSGEPEDKEETTDKPKQVGKHEPKLRETPGGNPAKKNLVVTEAAIKKSGVVYLSRVPPFMKPTKLRSLLQPYGKINRIFLSPEDSKARARRIRGGGNKKRTFTDGWVEFVNKKDAKAVCDVLNGQTIGGKKGSFYRDDVWTLLYLKGFKWHHLTEQIAAENAERASRMRAEISKATKENKEFVRNVERAKMLDGMQSKKAAKQKDESGQVGEDGAETAQDVPLSRQRARTFTQVPVAKKKVEVEKTDQVNRVLSKIF